MTGLTDHRQVLEGLIREMGSVNACAQGQPWSFVRQVARDTWHAGRDVFRWSRYLRDARHEWRFLMDHFLVFSLAWTLAQKRALLDMVRGVPAVYLVFGNFDEVSHRRGPSSAQAKAQLYKADRRLAELYAVAKSLPEPYDVFFLTDHGQVDTVPFERRSGMSLEHYLLNGPPALLSEEVRRGLERGPRAPQVAGPGPTHEPAIINAGNFAHVYLTRGKEPLDAGEIMSRHSQVLARALAHPDIGLCAMRRGNEAVAVMRGGVFGLHELPRSPIPAAFSRHAVADLLRELPHMSTAGDIVLYGQEAGNHSTVGFAWEFGSHGGLTRLETDSVVMWPSDVSMDLGGLGHASELYEKLSAVYRN
jgi:hypothetical protein